MYVFDVTYRELEAARAARAFLRRSMVELRRFYNVTIAVLVPLLLFAAFLLKAPTWAIYVLGGYLAASILGELFFYFARPAEARRRARQFPHRRIELGQDTICITARGETMRIPWTRVRRVWTTDEAVLLVLNAYLFVPLPRDQLPQGAYEYLLSAGRSPTDRAVRRSS
jgi:hypothetical protein